jgi:hypothetical protein
MGCLDQGVAVLARRPLDCRPPHESRALLGDVAAADLVVGLAVLRGEACPAGQVPRRVEPGHVADLGDEDCSQRRPDAGDRLDRLEPLSSTTRSWMRSSAAVISSIK